LGCGASRWSVAVAAGVRSKNCGRIETAQWPGGECRGTIAASAIYPLAATAIWRFPMSWPVILSGVLCVAMLALGFNLLLPLGSGLETVCVLTGVASAMVFFGLVEGA
jgi:hypothetical protein